MTSTVSKSMDYFKSTMDSLDKTMESVVDAANTSVDQVGKSTRDQAASVAKATKDLATIDLSTTGPTWIKAALLLALVLYFSGCSLVSLGSSAHLWWVAPIGYVLSTLAFVQFYRVGFSCTSIIKNQKLPFESPAMRRILGQISLLLLMRPILSLRTPREAEAPSDMTVLGSRRLSWVCYKIGNAFDIRKQRLFAKQHSGLSKNADKWLVFQTSSVVAFAVVFFSALTYFAGISGVIRYWVIPFVAMHAQLGSFGFNVSKEETRANANKVFQPLTCGTAGRVKPTKIEVAPALSREEKNAIRKAEGPPKGRSFRPHWFNIIYMSIVHLTALYGLTRFAYASWPALLVTWATFHWSQMGVTAGVHRLWAHRTYSAHWTLQIFLMIGNSIANEGSILKWSRDHRVHHKHVDTDLDPHDASRGFWYSHMGWLMAKKEPEVVEAGRNVHMQDLYDNPIVMFQHRNYAWFGPGCALFFPALLVHMINGDGFNALMISFTRYMFILHITWTVNSLAHLWGSRPYLPNILPRENWLVSIWAVGEGWHNYHHAYPYDYSASEYSYTQFNPTTVFLDICAVFGLVWDRRRANLKKGEVKDEDLPTFTMEDVKAMVNQAAMLIVVDGYVYDVAQFVDQKLHPGGEGIIKAYIGKDISETFRAGSKHAHTEVAYALLAGYKTGKMEVREKAE